MSALLSRSLMTLAACSLGERRRDWAAAMEAEFDFALADGKPLSFALGCLAAAWREMPCHSEGRFLLGSYALVLGLVLPMAALLSTGALLGFPYVEFPGSRLGFLAAEGQAASLLNEGDVAIAPSLTLLVLLLAAVHLLVGWSLLERDWPRAASRATAGAAATTTLVIFNATLFLDPARMLLPILCLAMLAGAIRVLARWHDSACGEQTFEEWI